MLEIHIDAKELWDDKIDKFTYTPECDLKLEHSLVSISKWEAKYHKSFIDSEKSVEETLDYIKMMVIGKKVPDEVFNYLSKEQVEKIGKYINDPMTATTIPDDKDEKGKGSGKDKFTTSEEIYYYMIAQNIPIECQFWHLNRLITLIKVCAFNNKPEDKKKKKLTSADLTARRVRMEAARKKYGG